MAIHSVFFSILAHSGQVRFHMENKVNYDNDDETQHIFFYCESNQFGEKEIQAAICPITAQMFWLSNSICSSIFPIFFCTLGNVLKNF